MNLQQQVVRAYCDVVLLSYYSDTPSFLGVAVGRATRLHSSRFWAPGMATIELLQHAKYVFRNVTVYAERLAVARPSLWLCPGLLPQPAKGGSVKQPCLCCSVHMAAICQPVPHAQFEAPGLKPVTCAACGQWKPALLGLRHSGSSSSHWGMVACIVALTVVGKPAGRLLDGTEHAQKEGRSPSASRKPSCAILGFRQRGRRGMVVHRCQAK